jgi:hypothetical protein
MEVAGGQARAPGQDSATGPGHKVSGGLVCRVDTKKFLGYWLHQVKACVAGEPPSETAKTLPLKGFLLDMTSFVQLKWVGSFVQFKWAGS